MRYTKLGTDLSGIRSIIVTIHAKFSALEVFLNDMRYINPRSTYLLK